MNHQKGCIDVFLIKFLTVIQAKIISKVLYLHEN